MTEPTEPILYCLCWRVDGIDDNYKSEPLPLDVCERWLAIEKSSGYTFTTYWIERSKPE